MVVHLRRRRGGRSVRPPWSYTCAAIVVHVVIIYLRAAVIVHLRRRVSACRRGGDSARPP